MGYRQPASQAGVLKNQLAFLRDFRQKFTNLIFRAFGGVSRFFRRGAPLRAL
jgi:hypothetical protein